MNFKNFLDESVEVKKYGNGTQEIVGENISCSVFTNVSSDGTEDYPKRVGITITTKAKNSVTTHKGEGFGDEEKSDKIEWERKTQEAIIKALEGDIEKLDAKISKLYEQYLGSSHKLEK